MSYILPTGCTLGSSKTGLAIGYRLVDIDGVEVNAFTTTNVVETSVPGNYTVDGGITMPDGFEGRIEFGTSGTKMADLWIGPRDYENLDAKISSVAESMDPLTNPVPGSYAQGSAGAALGRIGVARIEVSQPITVSGEMKIRPGFDYLAAENRAFEWTDEGSDILWPALTGATVEWVSGTLSFSMDVIVATGSAKKVRLELTAAESAQISAERAPYIVQATLASDSLVDLAAGAVQPE